MKFCVVFSAILLLGFSAFAAESLLSFLDFGLSLLDHGQVDYSHTPLDILCADFDADGCMDIARFDGNKLEIFFYGGEGYTRQPQMSKRFDRTIQYLRLGGTLWDLHPPLVVTLADGSEEIFYHHRGDLYLGSDLIHMTDSQIPRYVSEAEFEIVWESGPKPYGMDRCAVGDLDNDGINEVVTWWKESQYADTAWINIYKSVGDNEYELFMQEPVFTIESYSGLSYMMICDIDQNGQKELCYTLMYAYFWEFTGIGDYTVWKSNVSFPRAVQEVRISDVDQDGISEIAALTCNSGVQPPTAYIVEEFNYKSPADSMIFFNGISGFYYDYPHMHFDVGDFDNDGVVDMVSGVLGWATGQPVDICFFRYDPGAPNNFSQEWLYTGIPATCAIPIVEDMDCDGLNELYSLGVVTTGGSAFLYEGVGLGVGGVTWMDTTSMELAPTEACYGYIDSQPSVLALSLDILPFPNTILALWSLQNDEFRYVWCSGTIDSTRYRNPYIADTDQDGKCSILVADEWKGTTVDWEQISAGINNPVIKNWPRSFELYPVFPNPSNSILNISYELRFMNNIQLVVFNTAGQEIYHIEEKNLLPGKYRISLDGKNLSSGIFLVTLNNGKWLEVQKAAFIK